MAIDPYQGDAAAYEADLLAFDETIMGYAFGPAPRRTWRRRRAPSSLDYLCTECGRLRIDCGHPRRPQSRVL